MESATLSSSNNGASVPRRYSSRPIPKRGRVKLGIAAAIAHRVASVLTIHIRCAGPHSLRNS
ncbi:hypothetical protein CDL15_Pgr000230 [Punica granatum]|uniref:Uncharacterized protein n=1 Tax=Punica granatum TaxID=22663 RepID=A0A218Y335_PUNGR|nr:hypothetical protein CDL15_Pgr000230 [Punica granatum]